jgi:heat shock protein HslJ
MKTISVVIALAFALTACGTPSTPGADPDPTFDGAWILVDGRGPDGPIKITDDYSVTLNLDGKTAGGIAACNHYGGDARIDGRTFDATAFSMTEMGCADDAMIAEARYIKALDAATTITRDGSVLSLRGPDVDLRFEFVPPPPTADLVDTDWQLQSLLVGRGSDGTASSTTPATLHLSSDGTLKGTTGCRAFTGTWQESQGGISLTRFGVEGSCAEGSSDQDDHILNVIGDGFTAKIDGQTLTIYALHGQMGLGYSAG